MKTIAFLILISPIVFLYVLNQQLQQMPPIGEAQVVATPIGIVSLPAPKLVPTVVPSNLPAGGNLLEIAERWLGTRYQWGGCTLKGVDCSCFVKNVLEAVGVRGVPRTTVPQFSWGTPVSDPQLGDLVFFNNTCTGCGANPTHVGLAIGGGMMVHCGDPCQVAPISSFGNKYAGARRPPW